MSLVEASIVHNGSIVSVYILVLILGSNLSRVLLTVDVRNNSSLCCILTIIPIVIEPYFVIRMNTTQLTWCAIHSFMVYIIYRT